MNSIYVLLFVLGLSVQTLCGLYSLRMAMLRPHKGWIWWVFAVVQVGRAINRALVIPVLQERAAVVDLLTLFVAQVFPLVLSGGMLIFIVVVYRDAVPRLADHPY